MEEAVATMKKAPVAGRPESALVGSLHPHAGDPIVARGGIAPVAGGPEIAVPGAGGWS
jgi:hypothetical protein